MACNAAVARKLGAGISQTDPPPTALMQTRNHAPGYLFHWHLRARGNLRARAVCAGLFFLAMGITRARVTALQQNASVLRSAAATGFHTARSNSWSARRREQYGSSGLAVNLWFSAITMARTRATVRPCSCASSSGILPALAEAKISQSRVAFFRTKCPNWSNRIADS